MIFSRKPSAPRKKQQRPEFNQCVELHKWALGLFMRGVPILHFHMKNEGNPKDPGLWADYAIGSRFKGWWDSTFLVLGKKPLIIFIEHKHGKKDLSDSQKAFRDIYLKPNNVPYYTVEADNAYERIAKTSAYLRYEMAKAGYDTREVY